ncbi:MAG TPA: aminotransferase class I/II-fold pyridoxal phosphate-dependent enzyme [Vicinamibacterales bacterium]|jgi:dTDP-4-amino-4,6-dideoxygalactose transaminase|nr:aminotransferase class I/II-fold pyridoxal phosphate-dependent enzyme [Vicinamibacterales bacterium]
MKRILLSPPDVGIEERRLLLEAFDSNWIAPVGPQLDAFEREFAEAIGVHHAVALSSGTAALHLGLIAAGVQRGDRVITSTLTFAATANAAVYVGAQPVFVDVSPDTWTLDPDLVAEELAACARHGRRVGAVIAVDLYGQCADYSRLLEISDRYGVPLIADAAEALGASYRGIPAGGFGLCAAFSFNGNKIITTGGGGMLVSHDRAVAERVRHLATQAREPVAHYEHLEVGYNYRMSNLLAAVGRGQLATLSGKVAIRREINQWYRSALTQPGISFMPEAAYGRSNGWLTCIRIAADAFGATRDEVRTHLEAQGIESRPVWKPLHLQPAFRGCETRGGGIARGLFLDGLCLPSGSSLSLGDQCRVIAAIEGVHTRSAQPVRLRQALAV